MEIEPYLKHPPNNASTPKFLNPNRVNVPPFHNFDNKFSNCARYVGPSTTPNNGSIPKFLNLNSLKVPLFQNCVSSFTPSTVLPPLKFSHQTRICNNPPTLKSKLSESWENGRKKETIHFFSSGVPLLAQYLMKTYVFSLPQSSSEMDPGSNPQHVSGSTLWTANKAIKSGTIGLFIQSDLCSSQSVSHIYAALIITRN